MDVSKLLVTKSNVLTEAGYKLSLNEQRLILCAISKLDGRKPMPQERDFTITAIAFADIFGLPVKQAYETLDNAVSRLYERDIKTFDRKGNARERFRWVDYVKYCDGEGKVTLSFSSKIIPYLTLLHNQLTTYDLKQIAKLNSAYAIRFYELLIQFKSTGERFITIAKLKERLELTEQYSRFYNLKKRIIEPSIANINQFTDLHVDWDVVKKGRDITGLSFVFEQLQRPVLSKTQDRCPNTIEMFEMA